MIALSEYLGFVFAEITRARGSADQVSAAIAQSYAADPIMKHFSVPRFRIPELTVSIPMVISGAKFSSTLKLQVEPAEFAEFVSAEVGGALYDVQIRTPHPPGGLVDITNEFFRPPGGIAVRRSPQASTKNASRESSAAAAVLSIPTDISHFYNLLVANLPLNQSGKIVEMQFGEIFQDRFAKRRLTERYRALYPNNELFSASISKVQDFVTRHTTVDKVKMENLLVNPESSTVKAQAAGSAVFTITAKISEEGVFIKSLKDEGGQITSTVEFD